MKEKYSISGRNSKEEYSIQPDPDLPDQFYGLPYPDDDAMPLPGNEWAAYTSPTPVDNLLSGYLGFDDTNDWYLRYLLRSYYPKSTGGPNVILPKRNAYFMKAKLRHG